MYSRNNGGFRFKKFIKNILGMFISVCFQVDFTRTLVNALLSITHSTRFCSNFTAKALFSREQCLKKHYHQTRV